jgi:hypothetical protein
MDDAFSDPQAITAGCAHLDEGERKGLRVSRQQRGVRVGQELALPRYGLTDEQRADR